MKCPRCGAWAEVLETRTRPDDTKRRRYECANLHRFTTLEHFYEFSAQHDAAERRRSDSKSTE
jgi:transcriptional regulator NrdR family protein